MACALRLFNVKSYCNLTDEAFRQTMLAVNGGDISQYQIKKVLKSIVKLEPIWIDMCVNSCCAYTGQYKDYVQCEYCKAPRFQDISANKNCVSRRQMAYFSIKDRLIIQYQDPIRSKELRYRANYIHHDNFKIGDVFDSERYRELLSCGFFNDERDVALIESVDEYQIFRQRTDDCWIVLIINSNLCPENRVKKENLMITSIIPGPKEPKHFNSFMYPIVNELKDLEGMNFALFLLKQIILNILTYLINL
jgi:hypothetical protein